MYIAAMELISQRYPSGEGGAAALRTETGRILTSISPDVRNDALSLCMEVGACLEAEKLGEAITHSLCLYRKQPADSCFILTACGICQERLRFWGGEVKVAVTNPGNKVEFVLLDDLMPYHWSNVTVS